METKLKKKKKNIFTTIKEAFADKKKRYLLTFLCIVPLLIVIGIFGFTAYKEVKALMDLANSSQEAVVTDDHRVMTMDYVLRDTETDYQMEIFTELKNTLEADTYDDLAAVELVAKNYVADFYTFSNKAGQYDIGGMYYWYSHNDEKSNAYLAARDGFYKYINYYMNLYGKENLIEVADVQVTKCVKESNPFLISEHVAYLPVEGVEDEWYDYREDRPYDLYNVTCSWTYKEGYQPSNVKFPTSINMLIIKRGKFEIIYTSESTINVKDVQESAKADTTADAGTTDTATDEAAQ
ncbi:MAG: hypothetical protein Q4D13_00565 [Erysipelotrichaceae bacterium]|nr:hypothetical protein [Erysipelotrichaceae bacterium]